MSLTASTLHLQPLGAAQAGAPVEPAAIRPQSAMVVWLAASASLFLVLALAAAGQATLLRIAIPAGATLTGLALYLRRPIGYIHFTLWAWFITPLVRRLVDWRFGFEDQNLVLLAPFLVTAIAGLTLFREYRNARGLNLAPYMLCMAGIVYGFLVGVVRWKLHSSSASSLGAVVYGLFMWMAPLLFGLHLYLRCRSYEQHQQAVHKTFMWAVFLLGIYGIYQYVAAPPWDCTWLEGVMVGDANTSFGRPAPFEIRVWSTSNSPGTFVFIMLAGLVLLFGIRSRFKLFVATAGYLTFLLAQVRTAWLAWIVGLIVVSMSSRGPVLRRFFFGLFPLPLCLFPLMLYPQIQQAVQDRFATMQDVGHDESYQDRSEMYKYLSSELMDKPSGIGLLNSNLSVNGMALDSGLIQVALMLGFVGAALFAAGMLIAIRSLANGDFRGRGSGPNAEEIAYRAIFAATFAESLSGNIFVGVGGTLLWTFLALWMSAGTELKPESIFAGADQSSDTVASPDAHIGRRVTPWIGR
jgi:hypothetical protein